MERCSPLAVSPVWLPARPTGPETKSCCRKSAPRPHEVANSEIEADKHQKRDKPLIALGRTVRDDKHAAW
jgi:hypothetical protein